MPLLRPALLSVLLPLVCGCAEDITAADLAPGSDAQTMSMLAPGQGTGDAGAGDAASSMSVPDGGADVAVDARADAAAATPAPAQDAAADGLSSHTPSNDAATAAVSLRVMSLNVYGHATLPQSAGDYAAVIELHELDVVGIQEGHNDWMIDTALPTDYGRADAVGAALGDCWEQRYQVFVNTCRGASFVSHERFDLSDGPNATRTGETAVIRKGGVDIGFIDVHWDHQDPAAKAANAVETAAAVQAHPGRAVVVVGDFNAGCTATEPQAMATQAALDLVVDGGIDCVFVRGASGSGTTVNAAPSDHPGLVAELTVP